MRWLPVLILRPGATVGAIVQHEGFMKTTALRLYGKRDLRLETLTFLKCRRMKSSQRWSLTAWPLFLERGQSG